MEVLKRKRTQFRRAFTTSAENFESAVMNKEVPLAERKYLMLTECADELFKCEAEIRDLWIEEVDFDEKSYQEDQDKMLTYRDRWAELRSLYIAFDRSNNADNVSLRSTKSSIMCTKERKIMMPKLEITKFDGDVKKWLLFWGQFKKIDEDPGMDNSDKFQYLLQCMELNTSPRQLVESYPPCGENYNKELLALKSKFARDDVLIETYVRGLLALMQEKGQSPSDAKGLSTLYDSLQMHLQALKTLGVTKDKYASILFPMVESALPDEILRAWHRTKADERDLSKLVEFLRQEVESEERITLARQGTTKNLTPTQKVPTCCFIAESKADKRNNVVCIWCEKDTHSSVECHKATKMSLQERIDHIKAKKACLNCLKQNHLARKCRSFPKCLLCKKRHITLMCHSLEEQESRSKPSLEPERANNLHCEIKSTTLLQTVIVQICNNMGKAVLARAMIDSGAQRSYLRKDIAEELQLKPTRKEFITHCLFGGEERNREERNIYDITVKSVSNDFCCQMSVVEQRNICDFLPKIRSNEIIEKLKINNIVLTETTNSPNDVTLLIGADISSVLLTGDFIHVSNSLTAIRTKLGWTIQGLVTGIYSSTAHMITTMSCINKIDISDLWELETLGIRDPAEQSARNEHDIQVLKNFENSISINEEGRYEVCLPWLDVPRPQTNYQIAKRRLVSTTNRLVQLGKIKQYDGAFKEWLTLKIIEIAPDQNMKGHYMPHHPVIKESSLTTKIRPVFDASAKDSNGISLISCLEKGVNLLEEIPQLLINFRKEAIGVSADIAKAFLQISLISDDRDYLRFLWWSDPSDTNSNIITYRHKRVVFGVASSPFHLIATINYHLDRSLPELMNTALKLKKSFYVDNCVTSIKSEEELNKFVSESKNLMRAGMFDLRGWVSSPIRVCNETKSMSVLGVIWDVQEDSIRCNSNLLKNSDDKLTKRSLLSVMQRVFDPIGFVCPTTILPKLLIQKTWSRNLTWDQELPEDVAAEFKVWLDEAHLINECIIPRRFTTYSIEASNNTLHAFCDASMNAYAVCIFLRSQFNEHVDLNLVLAKSRVTPINKGKRITIPRLELIAATLAVRLMKVALESLALPNVTAYYWTDSSVALTWIKGSGVWSVFVTNRVNEIKSASPSANWRHVPGSMNPADLPSRGISPKGLLDSRWWVGPDWLRLNENEWPVSAFEADFKEANKERKGITNVMLSECDCFLDTLLYFSVYSKIVRMIGWMWRWRQKPTPFTKELSHYECERAEMTLFKLIQMKHLDDIEKVNNLKTFSDDKGILRLDTKLALGTASVSFKYPIVLPGSETIVLRMVQQQHVVLQHAGVQTLLCNLRERFWIIGLRRLCRKVVSNCVRCKRFKSKACQPLTGSLPIGRMEAKSAFEVSGVDLAGPLILKSGNKSWIVLFTCTTYRAVHLEAVESLSTSEFIMALRRFIARRGRVAVIYSDNATNFRGLDNALNSLEWKEIFEFSSIRRISWNFLPPAAPWWGGFYERLIGVVKEVLRRVLGRASVTLTELQTVLCDCEATVNNRPLTYVSNSTDELQPLTPSNFIQPIVNNDVTDLDAVDSKALNARIQYVQALREAFRQRFRREYLSTLLQSKKKMSHYNIKVGDIVLIEIDDRRRINWPLGLVIEVFPGTDKEVRVARVRTASGEKVRPLQRLYPLEVSAVQLDCLNRPDVDRSTTHTNPDVSVETNVTETRTRLGRVLKVPRYLHDFIR